MKNLPMISTCVFLAMATLSFSHFAVGRSGAPVPTPGPGFTEAAFDAALLSSLMANQKCTHLRFYSAQETETSPGSVMVIGVDAQGAELNGGFLAKPYKLFTGISGSRSLSKGLTTNKATDACLNASSARNGYNTHFAKADVNALLGMSGCTALRVTPVMSGENQSMMLTAANIVDGRISILGSGSEFERTCSEPCPVMCGPSANYLCTGS